MNIEYEDFKLNEETVKIDNNTEKIIQVFYKKVILTSIYKTDKDFIYVYFYGKKDPIVKISKEEYIRKYPYSDIYLKILDNIIFC